MNHRRAAAIVAACALAVLTAAGCGTEPDSGEELASVCEGYNTLVNDEWPKQYGTQMSTIGEALANDDDQTAEEAVDAVRAVYVTTADGLRELAEDTSNQDLAEGLTLAADGLVEIADSVETHEDAMTSSDLMSTGSFAEGGSTVAEICAG